MRTWTLYICHDCGHVGIDVTSGLKCWTCGAPRREVEEVQVQEVEVESDYEYMAESSHSPPIGPEWEDTMGRTP